MISVKDKSKSNKNKSLKKSFVKAGKGFFNSLPMIIGVIFLVGIFKTFVTKEMISSVFIGNILSDTFIGAVIGSVSAGNPITSYIIGGELLREGVSLFAVTAFLVSWVTVGFIQLPAEIGFFGKKFAIARNMISLILSLIIAIMTVIILGVLT